MPRVTGKGRARDWGIDVEHALYREIGNWYHIPNRFPAALIDSKGYVRFASESDYRSFILNESKVHEYPDKNQLSVAGGIARTSRYITFLPDSAHPDEIAEPKLYVEGTTITVAVNRFERSVQARKKCLDAWGRRCSACDFDFGKTHGPIAEKFIHVHHLTPLNAIRTEYELDPVRDLRPVCPNCHSVIHLRQPQFEIDEPRALMASMQPNTDRLEL